MNRSYLGRYSFPALLVLLFGWSFVNSIFPQNNGLQAAPEAQAVPRDSSTAAVLDVYKAVTTHSKYVAGKATWKEAYNRYAEARASDVAEWTRLRDELKALPAGSDEALTVQRKIERLSTDISDRDNRMAKEQDQRHAQLIAASYEDLAVAAESVRRKSGYSIVLSFISTPMDPSDYTDVFWRAHRPIVTYDRSVDITDQVIEQMKK